MIGMDSMEPKKDRKIRSAVLSFASTRCRRTSSVIGHLKDGGAVLLHWNVEVLERINSLHGDGFRAQTWCAPYPPVPEIDREAHRRARLVYNAIHSASRHGSRLCESSTETASPRQASGLFSRSGAADLSNERRALPAGVVPLLDGAKDRNDPRPTGDRFRDRSEATGPEPSLIDVGYFPPLKHFLFRRKKEPAGAEFHFRRISA